MAGRGPVRVVLADDQVLVRTGIRVLLETRPDLAVVGEAADGETALGLVRELRPDVVLMDIRMPGFDGLAATGRIAADPRCGGTCVVMLTTFDLDEYVFEALRRGAAGFLVKNSEPDELVRGVRAAAAGNALLDPGVARRLITEYAARTKPVPSAAATLGALTERERQVLALAGTGLSNADIAARLRVSPLTAKTHVSRIMGKLAVRDRAGLVVLAYETGLVRPGWAAG